MPRKGGHKEEGNVKKGEKLLCKKDKKIIYKTNVNIISIFQILKS